MNSKYLKDFLILAGIIIIAAIGARILAGGETLDDYARKNPQNTLASEDQPEKDNDAQIIESKKMEPSGDAVTSVEAVTSDETMTSGEAVISDNAATSGDALSLGSKPEKEKESDIDITSDNTDVSPERIYYMDGFYYEPISNEVFKRISGISYPVDCSVALDDLRYVVVQYVDFNGDSRQGELICNKELARDMTEIFYELYQADYRIESIKLVDEFGGDDTASMLANNTSCFNYRVVEGTTRLSNHSYGRAIDINPFYNPYITYKKDGSVHISPEGSEAYADRSANFPYKIDENDLAYKLFTEHGFTWGGNWNNSKDYQHFERK